MRTVRFLRECVRDAVEDPIDRITAASTLGAMGLMLCHVETATTAEFLMAWWGAGAGVYGALVLASAPVDGDDTTT